MENEETAGSDIRDAIKFVVAESVVFFAVMMTRNDYAVYVTILCAILFNIGALLWDGETVGDYNEATITVGILVAIICFVFGAALHGIYNHFIFMGRI